MIPNLKNISISQKQRFVFNFITIIYLGLVSFIVQASGNNNALICSTQLGGTIQACPINKEQYATSFSHIPEYHTSCDSSGFECIEAQTYGTTTDYFTVYDVDANTTTKYAITVTPTLFNNDDSVLQYGEKELQTITPTDDDIAVTQGFNDVLTQKKYLDKMLTLTQNPNGSVTDANGQTDYFVDEIEEECPTAIDFKSHLSGCSGYLFNSIRQGVRDNAQFHAFISALEQLQTVINVVIPGDVDLSNIRKLSAFKLKIMLSDDSILVIDVQVEQGVTHLSLNMNGSSTTDGRSFAIAFSDGVFRSSSFGEANSLAENPAFPVFCKPVNLSSTEYNVVKTIIIKLPDGKERVVTIYSKDTYFYSYQNCG